MSGKILRTGGLCLRPAGHRGMALLLVISVISLLMVVIMQFSRSMRLALVETVRYQERAVLEAAAQSGIAIGYAVLRADRLLNDYDSLLENWAKLQDQPLAAPFSRGAVQVRIVDLDGRFPINWLIEQARAGQNPGAGSDSGLTPEQAREMFLRLLLSGEFAIEDEAQARDIVDAVVDWLDSNDDDSPYGAESSYYESLEKPYQARNGMLEFVEELALVRGMTPELLYGNDEKSGLAEYITVHSAKGRININTAPAPVLLALDDRISPEDVENIIAFRQEETSSGRLGELSWYQGIPGWPGDIVLDTRVITIASSAFLVSAEATYNESRIQITAEVNRADNDRLETFYIRMD